MNKKFIFLSIGLLLLLAFPCNLAASQENIVPQENITFQESIAPQENITFQESIASEIIRLHVIANSDTDADQALKLKVKDQIVLVLRDKLKDISTKEEAKSVITQNLALIEHTAASTMRSEGYSYTVNATLSFCDFPIKQYGDLTFPAGRYEALRIKIGKSEGKNWWCVMFPSLCYVNETYDEITEENKAEFRKILTEKEYQSLLSDENTPIFYKSKIKLLLDKVIDYFSIKG